MRFSSSKYAEMRLRPGLRSRPRWESLYCSEKNHFLCDYLVFNRTQGIIQSKTENKTQKEERQIHKYNTDIQM